MVLTDNDMLIIYCCLGSGVGLVLILLVSLCCRRRRAAHRREISGPPTTIGRRSTSAAAYRSLNNDNDDGSPDDDHDDVWRKRSKITRESSNGGGDLADYLQNLVDGMEKGRAAQLTSPPDNTAVNKQQRASKQTHPTEDSYYRGGDTSLLTLGPTSSSGYNVMRSPSRVDGDDQRQGHRWASTVVRIGAVDGDGNELSGEKISGIERWRESVARETTSVGDSSVVAVDEPSPSSFASPASLRSAEGGGDRE
jgi:hypothetical protein